MKNIFYCLLVSSILFSCAKSEESFLNDLEGNWMILNSQRLQIFKDGSTVAYEDILNAGTLRIYKSNIGADKFKEFDIDYTNFQGGKFVTTSSLYTDEELKRVGMVQVLCNFPFECDIVWTIDESSPSRQVWSAYGNQNEFFWTDDRFDPSDDEYHLMWTITLIK